MGLSCIVKVAQVFLDKVRVLASKGTEEVNCLVCFGQLLSQVSDPLLEFFYLAKFRVHILHGLVRDVGGFRSVG